MFYDDLLCSLTNSAYCQNKSNLIKNESGDAVYKELTLLNDLESIVILGKEYTNIRENLNEITQDIYSRYWFTYRKGFKSINNTNIDSDSGWGCMLRCGQMLLAECFLRIYLQRDYKYTQNNGNGNSYYWKILNYFRDEKLSSYSVQQIATMGINEGIEVGKWFGPNTIIQVLNKLSTYDDTNHLKYYIAMDNCVYIDEIYANIMKKCNKLMKCSKHPSKVCHEWNPLLLVLPLRLGLNEFNVDLYKEKIKKCLSLEQSVGMLGGKPYSAYYFYGYTSNDCLLYLDPHVLQMYEPRLIEDMLDSTYHTSTIWKLNFNSLDPSVALAFLCKTDTEFRVLIDSLREINKSNSDNVCLIDIYDTKPKFDAFSIDFDADTNSDDDYVVIQ